MANYATLKAAIQQVVKTNGNNEITGALLQQSLLAMVNSLGANFQFAGIALTNTNPGTPDQNVFYLCGSGTYPNFDAAVVPVGSIGALKYNGSWTVETVPVGKDYDQQITEILGMIYALESINESRELGEFESGKIENATLKTGCYLNTAFNEASIGSVWEYYKLRVVPGQKYKVGAYAGQAARLWLMMNGDVGVSFSSDSSGTSWKEETITIPNGVDTLVINNNPNWGTNTAFMNLFVPGINSKSIFVDNDKTIEEYIDEQDETLDRKISDLETIGDNDKARELGVFEIDKLNESVVIPNYYFNTSFAQTGPYSTWEYLKLAVKPGEKYRVSAYAGQAARLWLMMNGNVGVSFSSDSSATNIKTETVEIPYGVDTLIVNARIQNATEINAISILQLVPGINAASVFVEQNKTIKEYVDEKTPQIEHSDNILYGKILVCAGDSITQGADMDAEGITQDSDIDVYQSDASGNFTELTSDIRMVYGYQIAARNKMTFYNAGISGSTMQGIAERNGFSLANGRYTKLPDNIDYLTIFFGWNDTAYGTLGTIDDVTNETYYGGYNVVMPYLINKYPFAKIALIVPFGTDVGHRNAIRELADKWGVACFDMYQGGTPLYYGKEPSVDVDSAIVTSNRAKFQANGAHPNYKGHRQIGDMLEHFLRGI